MTFQQSYVAAFFFSFAKVVSKLIEKQAKLYSKWLFICMLGGLTLCPVVNGDRKKNVSFYVLF